MSIGGVIIGDVVADPFCVSSHVKQTSNFPTDRWGRAGLQFVSDRTFPCSRCAFSPQRPSKEGILSSPAVFQQDLSATKSKQMLGRVLCTVFAFCVVQKRRLLMVQAQEM